MEGFPFPVWYKTIVLLASASAERTRITEAPVGVHLAYDETSAEFNCAATGDDSTPVSIGWYRLGSRGAIANRTGRVNVTVSLDGTVLAFDVAANDTDGWAMLAGSYRCVASNGYSSDTANFSVVVDLPPTPLLPGTTPRGQRRHRSY